MISNDLQILGISAASAVDTALLISLLERRNVRHLALPVVVLLFSTWLFHCGELAILLLSDARSDWGERTLVLAMSLLSLALLLMPSSLLHATIRLWRTGFAVGLKPYGGYAVAYVPLLLLPWIVRAIMARPGQPFLTRVVTFVPAYALGTCAVNLVALAVFIWHRRRESQDGKRFLTEMASVLLFVTALLGYFAWARPAGDQHANSPLMLILILAPSGATLLFAYHIIQYRLMHLILERTVVYGAILLAAFVIHARILQDATDGLPNRFRLDFMILEGIVVLLLVLLYQPLRYRVTESLRYLLARNVMDNRERTRRLAVEMWQHFDDDPQALGDWFVTAVRQSFDVEHVAVWLLDSNGRMSDRCGDGSRFADSDAVSLHRELPPHSFVSADGRSHRNLGAVDLLHQMSASLAVRVDHLGISGLLVCGRRSRGREFSEEETNAVLLLFELLGVTFRNHYLQVQRREAERVAAQNEKLSTLGLMTTCLAHEIKNPLSSIKTIAALMAEQFGNEHPQAEDVRLILNEVERLSATTGQFLKFARPVTGGDGSSAMPAVIDGAVQVLGNLARSKGVAVQTNYESELPCVAADENSVREIVFNLLLNSIEATSSGGTVRVDVRRQERFVVTSVRDDGPGIPVELQDQIFTPFVTSKPSGTGLGLYIVRRNVEHLQGEIRCESLPNQGTCFTVKLPNLNGRPLPACPAGEGG